MSKRKRTRVRGRVGLVLATLVATGLLAVGASADDIRNDLSGTAGVMTLTSGGRLRFDGPDGRAAQRRRQERLQPDGDVDACRLASVERHVGGDGQPGFAHVRELRRRQDGHDHLRRDRDGDRDPDAGLQQHRRLVQSRLGVVHGSCGRAAEHTPGGHGDGRRARRDLREGFRPGGRVRGGGRRGRKLELRCGPQRDHRRVRR